MQLENDPKHTGKNLMVSLSLLQSKWSVSFAEDQAEGKKKKPLKQAASEAALYNVVWKWTIDVLWTKALNTNKKYEDLICTVGLQFLYFSSDMDVRRD